MMFEKTHKHISAFSVASPKTQVVERLTRRWQLTPFLLDNMAADDTMRQCISSHDIIPYRAGTELTQFN